ncbi:MAG: hypothetical protein KME54_09620 [Tolypothrix brevis GSE-NOS-MK-07-07A]|jgi:predicted transposase/invertase (TIGR01784 family)|nr:hypothetical protein [Tolypothrix brevis GSE-NOS-MK-07-07A]
MFSLSEFKQTRFYQDAFTEGKLEGREEGKLEGREEGKLEGKREFYSSAVRRFWALGLSLEQIAEGLGLSIEEVR